MAELGQRVSAAELTEWMEFFRLEPFGPEVESWRAGMIASVVANVNRGKGTKPYKPADFMLKPPERSREPPGLAAFRTLAARASRG